MKPILGGKGDSLKFLTLGLFLLSALPTPALDVVVTGASTTEELAPMTLRGYGTVSSVYWTWALPGGPASILQITCQDEEKAKLLQAKYVSDLQVLPGLVAAQASPDGLQSWQAAKRNWITAVRAGTVVFVLNAANQADLQALFASHLSGDKGAVAFLSDAKVPMYLDKYDRYGFRFYYYPWQVPPANVASKQPYDFAKDFEDAAHFGTGLVYFNHENNYDTAEGQSTESYWSWAFQAARAKGLPQGLNSALSNPFWIVNRYRAETAMKMPGFTGAFYGPDVMETPLLSWNSVEGNEAQMANLQQTIRRFTTEPTLTSWMEPHQEMDHGAQDVFLDFGPAADGGYRRFLQEKYKDVSVVAQRWGRPQLKSWDQVKVPELIHFCGGDNAISLAGTWKLNYENAADGHQFTPAELRADNHFGTQAATQPAPAEWFSKDFDDSTWAQIITPSDRTFFLPQRPAVYRRTFQMEAPRRAQSDHWWVYIWDLNRSRPPVVMPVYMNGIKVGESPYKTNDLHWAAFDVTQQLQDGTNQISLRLPLGYLAYQVYLSPDAPSIYPKLGEGKNAEWADFVDWRMWSHYQAELSGTQMIREIDPNRQLEYAHPDEFMEQVRHVLQDYGGEFHCTGYMSGFFADQEPMMARGIDCPATLEPGGPAKTLPEFQRQMGLNFTEGIQAIDYFINIGDVAWFPDIRKYFEDNLQVFRSVGKYHPPKAQVALLLSERNQALTTYPFDYTKDPNASLPSGYWYWNVAGSLMDKFAFDGVGESDFATGNASHYKVIVDTNSSILDKETVDNIEKYVRNGGIFITFVQTGRNTSTQPDAWPISRLTGYNVTQIDPIDAGLGVKGRNLLVAPQQTVFSAADWSNAPLANGLTLEKREPDCQDLMVWGDGTTAVGMRPLGKGFIVQVGAKFNVIRTMDRWEGGALKPDVAAQAQMFQQLFQYFKVAPIPAHLSDPGLTVFWRHYVSNNGLDDVWVLWNQSKASTATVSLSFDQPPTGCIDLKDDSEIPVVQADGGAMLKDLQIAPLETRIFVTPRPNLETAGLDWFKLQRGWWQGTAPVTQKLKPPEMKLALDLNSDWAFHPLTEDEDVTSMMAPDFNDSSWEHRRLDIWSLPDHRDVKHGLYRKVFTVPATWNNGRVELWTMAFFYRTFVDVGRVYVDGHPLSDFKLDGIAANDVNGTLLPGTRHVLAMEIKSDEFLVGCRGECWLAYIPKAADSLDLSGDWSFSDDALHFAKTLPLPGPWNGQLAKRTVRIDPKYKGKNIILDCAGTNGPNSMLINGTWISHTPATGQTEWRINITPFVNFDADNEIELACNGPQKGTVNAVQLLFYDPAVYP